MMSKTAVHATTALMILAELPPGSFLGADEIARRVKAPRNYLGKILQKLAEEGLLESQKGKGGGFRLARPASDISLYDIVEPIDKISRWEGCLLGQERCTDSAPCPVHARWATVREVYLRFLRETKLSELVKNQRALCCMGG
ncbi:Rrf2 family transcriptional regulator [Thermogutta terrifontis]|jgi:Rrf2 family iron-sulfur cluster assembly transcriptional regulator|uniref:Rrf2 family transcriptional regulator n=1 Tax=Thermogutta terrifontis TaxID=1331910 RepID=A0A286RJV5_9BACT|nr:Rrf2 family transcriptional regulator [Thermogutta terrifontis]ASV76248.1 Rrf2 family transcriptional regulator [Thermogutta terrifontis]